MLSKSGPRKRGQEPGRVEGFPPDSSKDSPMAIFSAGAAAPEGRPSIPGRRRDRAAAGSCALHTAKAVRPAPRTAAAVTVGMRKPRDFIASDRRLPNPDPGGNGGYSPSTHTGSPAAFRHLIVPLARTGAVHLVPPPGITVALEISL